MDKERKQIVFDLIPVKEYLQGKTQFKQPKSMFSKFLSRLNIQVKSEPVYITPIDNPVNTIDIVAAQLVRHNLPNALEVFADSDSETEQNNIPSEPTDSLSTNLSTRLDLMEQTGRALPLDLVVWAVAQKLTHEVAPRDAKVFEPALVQLNNYELMRNTFSNANSFLEVVLQIAIDKMSEEFTAKSKVDTSPTSWRRTVDQLLKSYPAREQYSHKLIQFASQYHEAKLKYFG